MSKKAEKKVPKGKKAEKVEETAWPAGYQEKPIDHQSHAPYADFRSGASWRIFRIMAEFIEGFEFLADLKKEVTFFGSARVKSSDPNYKKARELGRMLGQAGYTVITGGGPGIMEAGNRGAYETGGASVGINIQLPREQRINRYVKSGKGFHYFFTRKVMLSASAQAYVYFPGGFGTMDELFEMITLIQTKKSCRIPIILVGKDYWEGLFGWVKKAMAEDASYIELDDMDIFRIVDTAKEAFKLVKASKERTVF